MGNTATLAVVGALEDTFGDDPRWSRIDGGTLFIRMLAERGFVVTEAHSLDEQWTRGYNAGEADKVEAVQAAWSEGYQQGRDDFADENGYA